LPEISASAGSETVAIAAAIKIFFIIFISPKLSFLLSKKVCGQTLCNDQPRQL